MAAKLRSISLWLKPERHDFETGSLRARFAFVLLARPRHKLQHLWSQHLDNAGHTLRRGV